MSHRHLVGAAALLLAGAPILAAPGGFIEKTNSTAVRPLLSASQIQAMLPSRGPFVFPAPYGTEGIRLTNASDCGGADCVSYVGYSYWRNINNNAGSATLLTFVSLLRNRGGAGPSLFRVDKTTGAVTPLGPLFASTDPLSWSTGEGWYFSATAPNMLYVSSGTGTKLQRYDVMAHALTTVFDVGPQYGADRYVWQMHSSNDDRVHSATLRVLSTNEDLGCMVYQESAGNFLFYPRVGTYDECQIDASGRWLEIKEDLDGLYGADVRLIDLQTGVESRYYNQNGAPGGHSDVGFGYIVGVDNFNNLPNAIRLYPLDQASWTSSSAPVVYNNEDWNVLAPDHISHTNAVSGVPPQQQYVCGSGANRSNTNRANEIECFRLDTSMDVLVVAPVMTNLDASGGGSDDYSKEPKGNLDPSGQYFIWTSNMGGPRQDAFMVMVPSQLLVQSAADTTPPAISGIAVSNIGLGGASIAWTTSEPADSQIDFGPTTAYGSSTALVSTMVTSHSQSIAGIAPGTLVHFRVRARDAAGNLALAGDRIFTTSAPDDPAAGMVAHWPLDEVGGIVAADATGSNHDATLLNGPTHVGGHDGAALLFNGVNQSGTVPQAAALDAFPLSLSLWIRTSATGTAGVVNKYLASSMSGYQVFVSGGNVCAWYFRDASDYVWDGTGCSLAAPGISDGNWHHVAFLVDAAGGRMYVDGVLRGSRVWTGTPGPTTTAQPLSFASYPGSATPYLAGSLDDVRLYGRALSPTEVTALYQAPGAPDPTTLNISAVIAMPLSASQVDISWDTTQPSDTQVEYGLTSAYGSTTVTDPLMLLQHLQPVTNLLGLTVYHFRVRSKNAQGVVVVSPDMTFKTPRRSSYSTVGSTNPGTSPGSDPVKTVKNRPLLGGGS
jgi:hypothetical protein